MKEQAEAIVEEGMKAYPEYQRTEIIVPLRDLLTEHEASDAATRAALKDATKEPEKAKATAGRLDPLSALAYQGLAYIVNDLDGAISKLSALTGEQV